MATFMMHLVIAERLWPVLAERWDRAQGDYLFGNLAPDVDKFCPDVEQATTHLVSKDGTDAWLTQRSRRFIDQQSELLRAPFADLPLEEQAFTLGYVCHLAADEATTSRYEAFRQAREARTRVPLPNEAIATVAGETAASLLRDREGLLATLEKGRVFDGLLPFVPGPCLKAMRWIVFPLLREGGGFEAYVRLVRRNSLWHRHGQTSEEPVDADLETELVSYRQRLLGEEAEARAAATEFDVAAAITASLDHCRARVLELAGLA